MAYKPVKKENVALLLAVLLSFWTWIYTYKTDAYKFWIALGANVLLWWTLLVPFGIWIWAIIDTFRKPDEYWEEYYSF